jgi:hypothetical protein
VPSSSPRTRRCSSHIDLETGDLDRWRAWQLAEPPGFAQLDRPSPIPAGTFWTEQILVAIYHHRPAPYGLPDFNKLRARGFRHGGKRGHAHEEMLLVKTYRYRDKAHTVRVDFMQVSATGAPDPLPPIVAHEFARDLEAAIPDPREPG